MRNDATYMAGRVLQAKHINFMAKHARGLICIRLSVERCELLKCG